MPFPPLVVSGQVVAASHINAIRNALAVWPGDVSADGYNLNDIGGLFFNDDPDTGIQRPSADVLQILAGGAVRLQADTALHALGSGQLSSGAPSGMSTFSVIANISGDTDRRMMFGIDGVNALGWIQVYDIGAIPYALYLNPQGGNVVMGSAWNGTHPQFGSHHLWVDSSGRLRIKSSAPVSDTDGSIVGAQS